MSKILIVEKTGVIKESIMKTFIETELYKKAGFKSVEGFKQIHQWTMKEEVITLYGKVTGRAGQENKYDFPPPVDETLFFGSCILVSSSGSLKKTRWETIYEELFGGFEDIGDNDSELSEDDDDDAPRTKTGYVKDGFIVDDDDEEEDDDDEDDNDDEEEEPVIKIVKPTKKGTKKAKQTVFGKIDTIVEPEKEDIFLGCTSELEEEIYEE